MNSITLHDKTFVPFISYSDLMAATDKVSERLNAAHREDKKPPILLCVLNGAIMYTAELMKRLDFQCELMTIKLSSYSGTSSTGHINIVYDIASDIRGRDVIICEDIIDTGATIKFLRNHLKEKGADKIEICTMLFKPDIYKEDIKIDYAAMEIPPRFIVGFGLDYDELGRNLKDIYVLK